MVAMVKSGVELAYEVMTASGIKEESAYYESLHETPDSQHYCSKKLFEMNRTISDTAERMLPVQSRLLSLIEGVYGEAGC